jgi:hypothetical protein
VLKEPLHKELRGLKDQLVVKGLKVLKEDKELKDQKDFKELKVP